MALVRNVKPVLSELPINIKATTKSTTEGLSSKRISKKITGD
jgi:hypothetical protein